MSAADLPSIPRVSGGGIGLALELLEQIARHPSGASAADIARLVGAPRATVYRTLDTLADLGVVTHVRVGDGASTYHLALDATRPSHLHAKCRDCGRIVDLPGDLLDRVVDRLARERDFALDPAHVALSGRCRACRDVPS